MKLSEPLISASGASYFFARYKPRTFFTIHNRTKYGGSRFTR